MALANSSRSSAISMERSLAPMSSTPCFFNTPDWWSSMATLSAVWPPMVGSNASGFSRSMTFSTHSAVMGSMYVRSAMSGSVMMVAGFEFTRTTRYPSSLRARTAWVPE